jgi:hypothetical protein
LSELVGHRSSLPGQRFAPALENEPLLVAVRSKLVAHQTPTERELVVRAVRELAEREDTPRAHEVPEMLEGALELGALELFEPDAAWWR